MSNTGQPAEKPTVELEAPPKWAIGFIEKMNSGFVNVNARLDTIEANQELTREQVIDVGRRQTLLEERFGKIDERQNNGSLRVKEESQVNLKQDAAIAQVIVRVDGVEKKVDTATEMLAENNATTDAIKKALSGVVKEHPQIVTGLVGLVMAAISFATAWFAKGH